VYLPFTQVLPERRPQEIFYLHGEALLSQAALEILTQFAIGRSCVESEGDSAQICQRLRIWCSATLWRNTS
jgi:hypothetical protein